MGRGKFDQRYTGEGSLCNQRQLPFKAHLYMKTDALKAATSWYRVPQRNISMDICAFEHSTANVL
jgi:hypothetical protein